MTDIGKVQLRADKRAIETHTSGLMTKHFDVICKYGIKDRQTYEMLRAEFYYRILLDRFLEFLSRVVKIIFDNLKGIGVSVVTSLITTYLCLKFFGVVR